MGSNDSLSTSMCALPLVQSARGMTMSRGRGDFKWSTGTGTAVLNYSTAVLYSCTWNLVQLTGTATALQLQLYICSCNVAVQLYPDTVYLLFY